MSARTPSTTSPAHRSWFDRLGHMLSGEPQSREELIEELRHAQANGLLSNDTLAMIEGAIEVAELTVADVMVPRAQMVLLPIDDDRRGRSSTTSSNPAIRVSRCTASDKDEILGILLAKDLLRCFARRRPCDIRALLRPAVMIPESKRLNVLLQGIPPVAQPHGDRGRRVRRRRRPGHDRGRARADRRRDRRRARRRRRRPSN